jgi:hypothetical protein
MKCAVSLWQTRTRGRVGHSGHRWQFRLFLGPDCAPCGSASVIHVVVGLQSRLLGIGIWQGADPGPFASLIIKAHLCSAESRFTIYSSTLPIRHQPSMLLTRTRAVKEFSCHKMLFEGQGVVPLNIVPQQKHPYESIPSRLPDSVSEITISKSHCNNKYLTVLCAM